jgi:hypothetical protein
LAYVPGQAESEVDAALTKLIKEAESLADLADTFVVAAEGERRTSMSWIPAPAYSAGRFTER